MHPNYAIKIISKREHLIVAVYGDIVQGCTYMRQWLLQLIIVLFNCVQLTSLWNIIPLIYYR